MINAGRSGAAGTSITRMDAIPIDPSHQDVLTIAPNAQFSDVLASLVAGREHSCYGTRARTSDLMDERLHYPVKPLELAGKARVLKDRLLKREAKGGGEEQAFRSTRGEFPSA